MAPNVAHQLLQKVARLLRKQKWRATFCNPLHVLCYAFLINRLEDY